MSRLGTFSLKAFPPTWFNDLATPAGWLPQDVVPLIVVIPPPPPPPPPPPRPRPRPSGGGGGGGGSGGGEIAGPYCVPDWLLPYCPPYYIPEPEEPEPDEDADYALLHVTEGAVVRAMAAGVVESFVDDRGRTSVVLTANDGTRYWYADVGKALIQSGARVRHGEPIARTRVDAPSIPVPTITAPGESAELPPHAPDPANEEVHALALPPAETAPKPTKPAQTVFVEAPSIGPPPAPPAPPSAPPTPRAYRLLPIKPPPEPPEAVYEQPNRTISPIVRAVAKIGIVTAILAALAWIDRRRPRPPGPKKRPPTPPKPKRPKKAKKRTKKRKARRRSRRRKPP